jgi:NADH-quinone oxidoreductase subunit H
MNLTFLPFLIIDFLITIITLLVMVAVLTLLERKVMAGIQRRRGPNVVGFFGLLQPFADGIKLVAKEFVIPTNVNKVLFISGPLFSFTISLSLWCLIPFSNSSLYNHYFYDNGYSILFLLGLSSLGVYGVIISGWASNSFYAFLGSLRASAQMISYEVSFALSFLPVVIVCQSFNLREIVQVQGFTLWNLILVFPSAVVFFISILAETNRTPFDLPEAEGELVAGFNVEYSAIFFALFFLAEYANIILMSVVFVLLFLGGWVQFGVVSTSLFSLKVILILFLFIWVRAMLPRYRYDQLIQIGWKVLLPFTMGYFIFVAGNFYFCIQLF